MNESTIIGEQIEQAMYVYTTYVRKTDHIIKRYNWHAYIPTKLFHFDILQYDITKQRRRFRSLQEDTFV